MKQEIFRHRSGSDGLELHVRRWSPGDGTSAPRATLLIAHGMAEHGGRYARLATELCEKGYEVEAPDHRGHGLSIVDGDPPGFPGPADGFARAVNDLIELGHAQRARHGGVPHLLLAHSMGSFLAQQILWTAPELFDGVALSGSNGPPPPIAQVGRLLARFERRRLGPKHPSLLLHSMSFGDFNRRFEPARTPMDWLSRDPAEVDAYIGDPLCGFPVSTEQWVVLLDALPGLLAPERLRRVPSALPVYLFAGAEDPVGGRGKGVTALAERYRGAGLRDVTVKLWPEARHEVLNETNRAEITAELVAWFERVIGSRRG